jgi:hypothetical protein
MMLSNEYNHEAQIIHKLSILKRGKRHIKHDVLSILESSRIGKFIGSVSKKIIENSQKWLKYFNVKQLKKLELIAGSQLDKLGFKTECPNSNFNPPRSL